MMKNKYSVIIMMIALFGGQTALAQEKIVPETPPRSARPAGHPLLQQELEGNP